MTDVQQQFPAWPREVHGHTQALAVTEALGAAFMRGDRWDPFAPWSLAEQGAHAVRETNWKASA